MRPIAVEAEVQLGEAEIAPIVEAEIDAVGEDPARIGHHEDQAADGRRIAVEAAGHRIAPEQGAGRIGRRSPR